MSDPLRILAWPAFKAKGSPYNALLYSNMQILGASVEELTAWRVLFGRYDIVHLHWPEYCLNGRGPLESLFWSSALFWAMCWVRLRGGKVFWTVHNLESHRQQYPAAERRFWRIFTALLNGYICLTQGGAEQARQRYRSLCNVPGFVIPHGNIREAYPGVGISREEARSQLGIVPSAKVAAFFGYIAPYKGVPELVEKFSALRDNRAVLLVAGKCSLAPRERKRIEEIAAGDRRVLLHLEYVTHAKVAAYFRAADLIVLPFRKILNSGSAVLALSLDRPVLVPARGAMTELQEFAGAEWVSLYSGELTSETLERQLNWAVASAAARGRCRALELGWKGLDWKSIAGLTLDAYHRIRETAAVTGPLPPSGTEITPPARLSIR